MSESTPVNVHAGRAPEHPAGQATNVDAKVEGGTASIQFVVTKANELYGKWMQEKVPLEDTKKVDAAYLRYRDEYREFAQCYPLAFRYIIQLKSYNAKAFLRYLQYVAKHPWKSYEDFLESQAEYDIILYKTINPKYNMREVKERREAVRKSLLDDWKSVKSAYEEAKKEQATEDKSLAEKIKAALLKQSQERMTVQLASPRDIDEKEREEKVKEGDDAIIVDAKQESQEGIIESLSDVVTDCDDSKPTPTEQNCAVN